MTKLSSNIKQSLKETLLFDTCYFIIFLFLTATFSDSSQTTGMFVLINFFVVVVVTVYYFVFSFTIQFIDKTIGVFTKALLFFVLAELSVLTLTRELPVFGLLQKYIYSKKSYSATNLLTTVSIYFDKPETLLFQLQVCQVQ